MSKSLVLFILFSCCLFVGAFCQTSLLDQLEDEQAKTSNLIEYTFKGTRLINGHSIETRKAGTLEFIIAHRFGLLSGGPYELFGLDNSQIRIGLEYAITDDLYIGLGRNSFEKTYDGFIKYRLIKQQTGASPIPISVTALGSYASKSYKQEGFESLKDKLAYTAQLLIARKFNSQLSLQVAPTYVHHNLILADADNNDSFAVGMGGRYKLSSRFSINAEYYWQAQAMKEENRDAIAIGVDIETGGHVFQLQLTNARSMIEKGFINETTSNFFKGDIHFGFNISRTF